MISLFLVLHSFAQDQVSFYFMCAYIVTSTRWEATPLKDVTMSIPPSVLHIGGI